MNYRCPVCAYPALAYPPDNYHICPCCGTEFGNDDQYRTNAELRKEWIVNGGPWFFGSPPQGWNPWVQLIEGHYEYELPFRVEVKRTIGTGFKKEPERVGYVTDERKYENRLRYW